MTFFLEGRPQGTYPESFVSIYLLLRYKLNKENRPIVIMPTHPKLTQVSMVIHEGPDVLGRPQGSHAESFASIYLLLAEI